MNNYTIIGIDFGTSATVVKIKNYYEGMNNNDCQPLMVGGSTVVPTLVFERSGDGKLFFGQDAEAEYNANSEGTLHRNFKMDLLVPEKKGTAERLIREFMKYLYQQFALQKAQLNVSNTVKTYISYPAKWTPEIISFMKQSVIDAGFGTSGAVFGETEPTAAIYASFTNHEATLKEQRLVSQDIPINVMMLDMGAGTSDVTVFRFMADKENKFHIGHNGKIITHPAVDNTYLCGGREIDRLLSEYNLNYLKQIFPDGEIPNGLKQKNESGIKGWKETHVSKRLQDNLPASISGELMTLVNMLRQYSSNMQSVPYPELNRSTFEAATKEHWSQLHTLMTDAIAKASEIMQEIKGPEDIDLLIVTGGHSQWYCVREMCLGHSVAGLPPINFAKIIENPERLLSEARPQETVANGLVYRDLSFDINHTSANNLWVQLKMDDDLESEVYSEVYSVLNLFDTLPVQKTINWEQQLEGGYFCTEDVKIECRCWYGADFETGVQSTESVKVPMNGLFDFLIRAVFLPLAFRNGGKDTYDVTTTLEINIDEDGSATINGNVNCNGNARKFVINL
ncbi:MAG: hypothetical protein J6031_02225 [Bacteroidales bacterium]|nr:hypothetical protein [Bacteroidales bacterium]